MEIRINDLTYHVNMVTQSDPMLGEDTRGKIWYERLLIFLDKELPNDLKVQTFYHELAHALCEETSFNDMLMDKLGDNGYEIFIDNLGKNIFKFYHQNNIKKIEQDIISDKE